MARAHRQEGGDPRARVLGVDELLDYLERKAQAAVDKAAGLSAARVRWACCGGGWGRACGVAALASLLESVCACGGRGPVRLRMPAPQLGPTYLFH